MSPYETEAAQKPSPAMHLLALLLGLSFCSFSSSFLTGDWSCSSAQAGATRPGALSGLHSPDFRSGCPSLDSYAHCESNALPHSPREQWAHLLLTSDNPAWSRSQEMVMTAQGDTASEGARGGTSARQWVVLGSREVSKRDLNPSG